MVGHDAKDPDAVIAIAAQGIEQKFQAGAVRFIRQDFGIGQPRVIVDGQMQIFPTLAMRATVARGSPVSRAIVKKG